MKEQHQPKVSSFQLDLPTLSVLVVSLGIFLASPPAALAQTYTVLHAFTGNADGAFPGTNLVMDRAGNLYGTVGSNPVTGMGGVFKLAKHGSAWVVSTLYYFQGADGASPDSLVLGSDGSLYGTNSAGGDSPACNGGCGTVFKLTPPPAVCKSVTCYWTATILHRFTGGTDGASPLGQIAYKDGNLYGTTRFGGAIGGICGGGGCGVVYELSPSSGGWTETVLHSFDPNMGNDQGFPYGGVIFDAAGNLYGTTSGSSDQDSGMVFELSPSGSGWTETILYSFGPYGGPAYFPYAGVVRDSSGNLYTTTNQGGSDSLGTVFSVSPTNNGWVGSILYNFNNAYHDGAPEFGNLSMDASGNLYGTTPGHAAGAYGNVFQMTPSSSGWSYHNLYSFTDGADGAYPFSTVLVDASGNLYGTTSQGGTDNVPLCYDGCGVVWQITP